MKELSFMRKTMCLSLDGERGANAAWRKKENSLRMQTVFGRGDAIIPKG